MSRKRGKKKRTNCISTLKTKVAVQKTRKGKSSEEAEMNQEKNDKKDTRSNLEKYKDPDYKGEELPDEIENGPVENRKCTDVLCCLIFLAFIIAWFICGFYGFSNGDPTLLTYPYDSDDNQCGLPGGDAED